MNIFRIFRLSLWSVLLAACITIGGFYLAIHNTFLTSSGLTAVVKESRVAETVRSEVLLPKILQTTRASDFSSLLDDKTVTEAFDSAVSTDTLNAKLKPAIDSLDQWLNSKEPSIAFSIDMSQLTDEFAATLSTKVNQKIATLPSCTPRSTLSDAQNGVCRSSLVTADSLSKKIEEMIKSDERLAANTTITPQSISLAPSVLRTGNDIPSYLNMLFAVTLVTTGLGICIALWLLLKHRLSGGIAVGSAAILGAVGLYVAGVIGSQAVGTFSTDSQVQQVARAGSTALETALQQEALLLCAFGVVTVTIFTIIVLLVRRRNKSSQTMHLSGDSA